MPKMIRITYVHSAIGHTEQQKRTVRGLGLRRLGDSVEHADSPAVRGMAASISHLVEVEEVAS